MIPAQQMALWADRLRDISAMGLNFAANRYDTDNYRHIQTIAMEMLALATNGALADLEPLRAPVFSRPTPITVGDAAVIDEDGRICSLAARTMACGRCPAARWKWEKGPQQV